MQDRFFHEKDAVQKHSFARCKPIDVLKRHGICVSELSGEDRSQGIDCFPVGNECGFATCVGFSHEVGLRHESKCLDCRLFAVDSVELPIRICQSSGIEIRFDVHHCVSGCRRDLSLCFTEVTLR